MFSPSCTLGLRSTTNVSFEKQKTNDLAYSIRPESFGSETCRRVHVESLRAELLTATASRTPRRQVSSIRFIAEGLMAKASASTETINPEQNL